MKKIVSLLLVLVLLMSLVTGCTKPSKGGDKTPETESPKGEDNGSKEPAEAGKVAKVGLGVVSSIAKSADAKDDGNATGQADVTVAAVGLDADGKVASVTIDTAQTKVEVDKDGKIATDKEEAPKSKKELEFDYMMNELFSKDKGIGKEWFEQIEALEEWMIGKTIDEITGMKFKTNVVGYEDTPDVAELESSVTISVSDYLAAVAQAAENAIAVENGEKVGLGLTTSIAKSKDAEDNKNAVAQMDSTMTATAFDADGKVVGTIIDTVQISVEVDKDGKIVSDKEEAIKTKHELKEDYGMKGPSEKMGGIGKEWNEQMEALQDWMVGKSLDEIKGMKFKENPAGYTDAPDVAELESSVTISVTGYLEIVEKASKQAK